jgi:predicted negative regulator of RcsB-dependent stress response
MHVTNDALKEAIQELEIVVNETAITPFKQIAKIRIARILADQKSYSQALSKLDQIVDDAYLSVVYELKGDIYSATGQYADAMKSYTLALEQDKINGIGNLYLEMKTNEIASKTQSRISIEGKVDNA